VSTAFTDAKWLVPLGMDCYGFAPMLLPDELDFTALFHGVDERVPVSGQEGRGGTDERPDGSSWRWAHRGQHQCVDELANVAGDDGLPVDGAEQTHRGQHIATGDQSRSAEISPRSAACLRIVDTIRLPQNGMRSSRAAASSRSWAAVSATRSTRSSVIRAAFDDQSTRRPVRWRSRGPAAGTFFALLTEAVAAVTGSVDPGTRFIARALAEGERCRCPRATAKHSSRATAFRVVGIAPAHCRRPSSLDLWLS